MDPLRRALSGAGAAAPAPSSPRSSVPPGGERPAGPEGRRVCDPSGCRIGVKLAAPNYQARVLTHELIHALAHTGPEGAGLPKAAREVQAEGAATLACYALGLDTSVSVLTYLKGSTSGAATERRGTKPSWPTSTRSTGSSGGSSASSRPSGRGLSRRRRSVLWTGMQGG